MLQIFKTRDWMVLRCTLPIQNDVRIDFLKRTFDQRAGAFGAGLAPSAKDWRLGGSTGAFAAGWVLNPTFTNVYNITQTIRALEG